MEIDKDKMLLTEATELRSHAEERLHAKTAQMHPPRNEEETQRLVHELEVHQIELEMQGEEFRQARDEAEAALEKYADLYDFAPVGYFSLDHEGIIRSVNLTGASLLEVERSRLLGRRFGLLVADEARPFFTEFLGKVFKSPDKEACEVALLKEGNSPLFVRIEGVVAASGQECRIVLINITERKLAEEKLRESEERLRLLIDGAKDCAIFMLDIDGRVTSWNEGAKRLMGWDAREILGRNFSLFYTEEAVVAGQPEHELEITAADGRFEEEGWRVHKDGSKFMADVMTNAIRDESGKLRGFSKITRDITARKRADEALRESEEQFRALADSIPNLAWRANGDGYITWYNRRWYEYTGTTPEQMEGWGWQTVHDPNELPKVLERWQASIATGESFDMTFPLRGADGVFRQFLTRVVPLKDSAGHVQQWFGTNTDVSALKRDEEMLRQQSEAALLLSEQEFRSLAEAMPQIVWATRPDGWNIYFNQQWVDYTGLTMEESYGHGWNTPFHPDDKQRAWDAWQRATQHNERYSLECRLRRADGVYRWWLIRGEPMRGADGEILKWFGTCTDIEELKRAEIALHEANALLEQRVDERTAALRKSEALYRGIGESIDYGVWVCAPDGRNIYASESFLKMVGITQEQCSNFGWGDVLHPDDAERTIKAWQECVRTGGTWDIEHRFLGTDGQWHHVLARGVPVRNEQGEITFWAGINLDISQLKQAEEQIKTSLAEKEVMMREIHHRVKNNLQVISSLVSLQADTLADERMRGVFCDVRDRVRAMALVHETLYQAGDLAYLNFADYAASLLQYLWRSYGALAEKVRFNLAIAPVTLPIEAAVPCGLILNELAGNTLKHAFPNGSNGEVTVGLELDPETQTVCLRVRDNGVGLPAGLEWRQSHSLGLRLVLMLAGQLRGTVETGPGPGAEFRVTFSLKGFKS
ncbi:MAG: PAS domain S-box protein [Steroidobacteraceae bacterium]|nr:PAS domain S-box protein [Deltaproteobacteria bacterium]